MNTENIAHILLICVIVVAMFAISFAGQVNADHMDNVIDISEPTDETKEEKETSEPTEAPTKPVEETTEPEVKEDIIELGTKPEEESEVEEEPTPVTIVGPDEFMVTIKKSLNEAGSTVKDHPFTKYYNVPLSPDIQDHIFKVCEEHGIKPEIIIAMIRKESYFTIDIMGDNGAAYGLLQVQPRWHQNRMDRLGVTDLLDPYQNITVAVDYLAECLRLGRGSYDWALMAYNGGPSYAREMTEKGEVSYYAQIVQKWARQYASY